MDREDNLEFLDFLDYAFDDGVERIPKRYLRDLENPVEFFREDEFKIRYRFSKTTVMEVILPIIGNRLDKVNNRGLPFPPLLQLLLSLRFYATGNFQVCYILILSLIKKSKKFFFRLLLVI